MNEGNSSWIHTSFQFQPWLPGITVGADTVTEHGFGMFGNVFLDLLPAFFVVSDLFAIHADGDDSFELFDP
jgi:hypothetical protein